MLKPTVIITSCLLLRFPVWVSVDRSQVGKAVVLVSVTDINDNAPSFASEYETFVCENSEPGQVSHMMPFVTRSPVS